MITQMRSRRLFCFATVLGCVLRAQGPDELRNNLQRIFSSKALDAKAFGPARWIRNGASFTTVEPSAEDAKVREIVEYETITGKRSRLVTAAQLTPKELKKPLHVEDYWWDGDMRRLLIFTETKKYWRTNSLGDYWVLNRESGELKKLGGPDTPASSLMYVTFSPDGAQVAYVRAGKVQSD